MVEINIFEILLKNKSIVGKDIQKIANISSKGQFSIDTKGIATKKLMSQNYLNFLLKLFI